MTPDEVALKLKLTPEEAKQQLKKITKKMKRAGDSGELLKAIDYAQQGAKIAVAPDDIARMRIDEVILLARSASHSEATEKYDLYELDKLDHADARSLRARLQKDFGLASKDETRLEHLRKSRDLYLEICEENEPDWDREDYEYNGINAVTLSYMIGDTEKVSALIERLRGFEPLDTYYSWATRAELLMNTGAPVADVTYALKKAIDRTNISEANKLTTLTQLSHINEDHEALELLRPRPILHYSGHIISAPGKSEGRLLAKHEDGLKALIEAKMAEINPSLVIGSLAAGADILIVETALALNIRAEVFLPFEDRDFHQESIKKAGANWAIRARACMANEELCTVIRMTRDKYIPDEGEAFAACSRRAMGSAILTARRKKAEPHQLVIWDGKVTNGSAGADADRRLWEKAGLLPTHIIDVSEFSGAPENRQTTRKITEKRRLAALVFGDAKNFSKLNEAQLPVFIDEVMGRVAITLNEAAKDDLLFSNTWGDGVFAVFNTAAAAAKFALDLEDRLAALRTDMIGEAYKGLRLPKELKLRLGMHYGVVFEKKDPVTCQINYFGEAVARAARIEPITKAGRTFVSEEFAAELAIDAKAKTTADYVGEMDAAKNYGKFRLYRIRAK